MVYAVGFVQGAGSTKLAASQVTLGSCEFGCGGQLFAGGDNADGGNIYTLSLVNGQSNLVGPSGFPNVTGLTLCTAPVPVEETTWGTVKDIYKK